VPVKNFTKLWFEELWACIIVRPPLQYSRQAQTYDGLSLNSPLVVNQLRRASLGL